MNGRKIGIFHDFGQKLEIINYCNCFFLAT